MNDERFTEAYIDAHPALCHAINETTARLIGSPALSAAATRHVIREWRDPQKRRSMEAAFETAKRVRRG